MALNGFSVLLLVRPAPDVLTETKRTIDTAFYHSPIRAFVNAIKNKVYYDQAITLYYFRTRKESLVTGQKS